MLADTGSTATASEERLPVLLDGGMPGGMGGPMTSLTPAYKDVAYASASSAEKLDLYLPSGNGPFPLVIMIHGGGFMSATSRMAVVCQAWTSLWQPGMP